MLNDEGKKIRDVSRNGKKRQGRKARKDDAEWKKMVRSRIAVTRRNKELAENTERMQAGPVLPRGMGDTGDPHK